MTLVMAAGIGSQFAVMTSDERISYRIGDELVPIDKEREVKIYMITNAVIFGWGGNKEYSMRVKKELSKVLTPTDTLEICKQHLEHITNNMDINRGFIVLLSGFYEDGSSGMVMFKTNGEDRALKEAKMEQLQYLYTMLPPTADYSDRQNELLHIEEFTPDNIINDLNNIGYLEWFQNAINRAVNQLIFVHGLISYSEPELTTSEGFYYVIYKDFEGKLNVLSGKYDTSKIYEQLRENEQKIRHDE